MKRRLESNLDTDPPCGLPGELWEHHIIPPHASWMDVRHQFITLRSLRCTCVWFARHITLRAEHTAHELFWPNVEHYALENRTDALRALEWPTHPHVSLTTGYNSKNYSYGRAGQHLAQRGDVETLMVMARHGGEYWTLWATEAIKLGHFAMLEALYTSGLRCIDSKYEFGHGSPRFECIEHNRLDMLRLVDTYTKEEPRSKRFRTLAIQNHCDAALLRYLGVTPARLQSGAHRALVWENDYAHVEYILDHYWTQRPTRAIQTRAQRLCALLTERVLREECKYGNTWRWAEAIGYVYKEEEE